MFQDSFQQLELSEVATILDRLNPKFEDIAFDPVETVVMAVDLDFYPGYRLLEIADYSATPALKRFVLYAKDDDIVLDFTNGPIYALNKALPIHLTDVNLCEYVRFFFTYVKGRHGRFLISESFEDINWKEEPAPAARAAIDKMLKPIEARISEEGVYHIEASMVFKDSLFKADIYVSSSGAVTLKNEELLIEDMPVLDDIFE